PKALIFHGRIARYFFLELDLPFTPAPRDIPVPAIFIGVRCWYSRFWFRSSCSSAVLISPDSFRLVQPPDDTTSRSALRWEQTGSGLGARCSSRLPCLFRLPHCWPLCWPTQ